MSKVMELLS